MRRRETETRGAPIEALRRTIAIRRVKHRKGVAKGSLGNPPGRWRHCTLARRGCPGGMLAAGAL